MTFNQTTISGLHAPHVVAVNPITGDVYATNYYSNTVSVPVPLEGEN